MARRVNLTLPDPLYRTLERWANSEQRPVANLVLFLIERDVREAQQQGQIPPEKSIDPTDENVLKAVELLRKLTDGEQPSDAEIIYASHATGISQEKLIALCDRLLERESNGFS